MPTETELQLSSYEIIELMKYQLNFLEPSAERMGALANALTAARAREQAAKTLKAA